MLLFNGIQWLGKNKQSEVKKMAKVVYSS